jgi:predicted dinucleotide-binding enzyme
MTSRHPMHSRRAFLQAAAALATVLPFASFAQSGTKLKIGTLGSGRVGSAIGKAWIKAGHEVMFSSIDLEADRKLAAGIGAGAHAGTPREAAAFGSVLLVSVPYAAMPALGRDLGDLLKGKIVIDTSNPIVARDGDMAVAAREKGAGLASTEFLPGARIVRTFNAIGAARMGDAANNKGERIGMPMAGDDPKAIEIASALVRDVGYEPVLVGTLAAMGKYLIPGTPLAGERSPDEVRKVAATLK